MQDPSAGVQQPLDKHVHLISGYQFPTMGQMTLAQAFEHLMNAPITVKQLAPMAWTYVNAPPDGTVWLEWLSASHAQSGARFPSDGYVWADPEQIYRNNFNGYQIEMLSHQCGFKPGFDHMTSHARTRYHLVAKSPTINAAQPDPSLWLVHYHQTQQQRIMPASQVAIDAYSRRMLQERQWLESQGQIERVQFMLHDREHWPTITVPGMAQQRMQGQPGFFPPGMQQPGMMPPGRYNQTPFPQQGGPPSAKRQRTQGPPQAIDGAEMSVEDEEYTALGDYFDHLLPREISMTRYQQHHRWIEEVFSSPYASSEIVPADLGLGLMGELKGLTEGILSPPDLEQLLDKDPRARPAEVTFTAIAKEQLEEFNARAQKHIDEGKAEIERMKSEHAAKMRAWRNTYKLTKAERQLRSATWKGHDSAIFVTPVEETDDERADVEDVVEEIEKLTGQKIKSHADATLVDKGGLEEAERPSQPANTAAQQLSTAPSTAPSEVASFLQPPSTADQTAAGAPANTAGQNATPTDTGLDLLNDTMDIDASDLQFDLGTTPIPIDNQAEMDASTKPPLPSGGGDKQAAMMAGATGQSTTSVAPDTAAQDNGMFNDSNFDFDNTGDDIGDGLIDFGDDGMGMDDNFGDALHGMDS